LPRRQPRRESYTFDVMVSLSLWCGKKGFFLNVEGVWHMDVRFPTRLDCIALALAFGSATLLSAMLFAGGPTTHPALTANAAGEWVVESSTGAEGSGQVFAKMIDTTIKISDDRISWVEKWGVDEKGKANWVRVDRKLVPKPEVAPEAVDLIANGPYKAWSRVAILRIAGDEMHLCVNFPEGPRPTKFEKSDDGSEFVVLRRVKKPGG
jgi:uncharacterized protein (TIGR03067 family)